VNSAVIFGLVSALSYGVTDYLSRVAGRAVGVWRSLFYGDLLAFVALSVWFLIEPGARRLALAGHATAWAASIASAIILLASAASLTRGLMTGTLAVVAPVAASYGAITAVLSAVAGEQLSGKAVAGIAVTVLGVCLVSIPSGARSQFKAHLHSSGLGWALGAAVGYGFGFWLQGTFAVPMLGAFIPVWLAYAIAIMLVAVFSRPWQLSLAVPDRAALVPVLATGAFSVVAYVALSLGLATGKVAIVVVLSTLASAVTVLLARLLDDARVAKHQWFAIAVIIVGLILIRS
jgi:drug/metabolite transporter (DMT)-like permease